MITQVQPQILMPPPPPPVATREDAQLSGQLWLGEPASERQQLFIDADEKEQLYGGAKRGGKSVGICAKLILLNVFFPGNRTAMYRKTLPDLRESTLADFLRFCPPDLILHHHRSEHWIKLRTIGYPENPPSMLLYGGLGDPKDFERVKGKSLGAFAIDEPSEVKLDHYLMMLGQLDWRLPASPRFPNGEYPPHMALLGSNPEPGWVEKRFRTHIMRLEGREDICYSSDGRQIFIRALPSDNPYLPTGYVEEMEANFPPDWVKKYRWGSWKVSKGQVFKEFDEMIHCIEAVPPDYLRQLTLVDSIDHAATGVTCLITIGIDPAGNLFVLDEYYQRERLISEHAQEIKATRARYQAMNLRYQHHLYDPSMDAKTIQGDPGQRQLRSIIDEYRRYGVSGIPAYNAVEAGIECLKEYFHVKDRHLHPFRQAPPSASIFIVKPKCPNLIEELTEWRRDVTDTGEIKYLGADHAIDNTRYIAMSRPRPPAVTKQDEAALSTHDQIAHRSHEAWLRKWSGQDRKNSYF